MNRPALRYYAEAALELARARLAVLILPPRRHFGEMITARPDAPEKLIAMIQRCLHAAGRRLPFRTQCYEKALAARAMLARRGYGAQLHFGGAFQQELLTAHVWLTSGSRIVTGADEAEKHLKLASSGEI